VQARLVNEQVSPRILLAYGWRELLVNNATDYVRVTLDRLLPALVMPAPDVFDFVKAAREDLKARSAFGDRHSDEEADRYEQDLLNELFAKQRFLQRQVREFAFAALFHTLERTVWKVLQDADRLNAGAVLKNEGKSLDFCSMLKVLARCGYDTTDRPFRRDLHKLNLISGAVKHGHGRSLTQLHQEFPEVFLYRSADEELTREHLYLTAELLNELANAVAAFWETFPAEQIVVASGDQSPMIQPAQDSL
jgi:2-hydroxychromene-2-carboxylate isomerase